MAAVSTIGSKVYADPDLQLLNPKGAKKIVSEIRDVYKTEKKGENAIPRSMKTAVLVAAVFAAIFGGPVGLAVAAALAGVVALYEGYKAIQVGLAHKAIVKVHADASELRLATIIQKNKKPAATQATPVAPTAPAMNNVFGF